MALVLPKLTGHFPGIAGLLPTTGAALIILLNAKNRITQLLANKTLVWVGALSYSLYLWHWPVLAFMRYYTGAELLNWQYSLVFVLITLTLATASYYWIETPLRLKRSKRQLAAYAGLAALVIIAGVSMKKMNAYFTPEKLPIEYTRYADPETICHGQIVGDCLKGDLTSNKEVLVLGDSHAAMLNHFFDYLGKELGFKARIITASSCVTIPKFDYKRIAEWAQKSCLSQIEEAQKYLKGVDIIFLAAFWTWQLDSNEFKEVLNGFIKSGKKIYILSQEPLLKNNPLRNKKFSDFGFNMSTVIDISFYDANNYLSKLGSINKNVTFIDLNKLELFENVPFYKGELIYYDEHHLNELGVKIYAKQFAELSNKINLSVTYDKGSSIE